MAQDDAQLIESVLNAWIADTNAAIAALKTGQSASNPTILGTSIRCVGRLEDCLFDSTNCKFTPAQSSLLFDKFKTLIQSSFDLFDEATACFGQGKGSNRHGLSGSTLNDYRVSALTALQSNYVVLNTLSLTGRWGELPDLGSLVRLKVRAAAQDRFVRQAIECMEAEIETRPTVKTRQLPSSIRVPPRAELAKVPPLGRTKS